MTADCATVANALHSNGVGISSAFVDCVLPTMALLPAMTPGES
ncbi:MAG: hypothetical protein ACOVQ0_10560 [Novosphingobium sp.]|jgi:hypothetical protein